MEIKANTNFLGTLSVNFANTGRSCKNYSVRPRLRSILTYHGSHWKPDHEATTVTSSPRLQTRYRHHTANMPTPTSLPTPVSNVRAVESTMLSDSDTEDELTDLRNGTSHMLFGAGSESSPALKLAALSFGSPEPLTPFLSSTSHPTATVVSVFRTTTYTLDSKVGDTMLIPPLHPEQTSYSSTSTSFPSTGTRTTTVYITRFTTENSVATRGVALPTDAPYLEGKI